MLQFYNTLTRKKEPFESIERNKAKVYSCGPTVYFTPHIGNLRAALFVDLLKRVLRYCKFEVIDVVNITDVGHLVSDDDHGEDKMLKAAKREKKDPYEIARYYEEIYRSNMKQLHIIEPKFMPRATEHIADQVKIVEKLEKKGYTYKTDDGIYFDVTKFKKYGRLSKQKLSQKKSGARVQIDTNKRHPHDFALWKFLTGDNKNHIMKWDTKWGEGFPGWHLECTAMSAYYLGNEFDIHTGGIDHIPVHHENEIAQNEASGAVKRINVWLHNDFMTVDGERMAKSLGSIYSLQDLVDKGYHPLALREMCLRTHYRKVMNFTFESLDTAEINMKRINEFYIKMKSLRSGDTTTCHIEQEFNHALDLFEEALKDDMNIPVAMSAVYEFMSVVNKQSLLCRKDIKLAIEFMERTDTVLGLLSKDDPVPEKVIQLAQQRHLARMKKEWKKADELREEIEKEGYEVTDSKVSEEGYYLEKK